MSEAAAFNAIPNTVTAITGEETKQALAADKPKRTRKCKNIIAGVMIENDTAFAPISGYPDNIVKLEKAERWVMKNALENGGPLKVVFMRLLGGIDLTPETKLKKRRT